MRRVFRGPGIYFFAGGNYCIAIVVADAPDGIEIDTGMMYRVVLEVGEGEGERLPQNRPLRAQAKNTGEMRETTT